MAIVPPVMIRRPSDQCENIPMEETNLLQQESPSNSNHNSSNLNYNPAITVHLSEELKWAQEIISLAKSGVIQIIPIDGMESTPQDLPNTTKSQHSILPFERSAQVILGGESPKSPLNSNGVSPAITEIQGKQITMLESPQPSAPNYVSKIDMNRGCNSGELAGAQS
ncbi:hypothetical protein H5410_037140 [Solanum commersonii]|uniref:Uncharacterized protein n=1 Tax=Solanum commersonii TaxID=4109 RepID=A0A9J5Y9D8_SOLCO|nr:hypothetical protein H5410_037140 [Solanum commersonii]